MYARGKNGATRGILSFVQELRILRKAERIDEGYQWKRNPFVLLRALCGL